MATPSVELASRSENWHRDSATTVLKHVLQVRERSYDFLAERVKKDLIKVADWLVKADVFPDRFLKRVDRGMLRLDIDSLRRDERAVEFTGKGELLVYSVGHVPRNSQRIATDEEYVHFYPKVMKELIEKVENSQTP